MLVGDLLLARRMLWISIMRSEPSEKGGDRDSDLSAGSEACTALSISIANGLRHPEAASRLILAVFLGPEMAGSQNREKATWSDCRPEPHSTPY